MISFHHTFWIFLENCVPYSEKTCRDLARRRCLNQGVPGKAFYSDNSVEGCYAYESGVYANTVFYGTDGTKDEMKETLTLPEYRPKGYDCAIPSMFV